MADLPPVPKRDKISILINAREVHPGLLFDRYFKCWEKSGANGNWKVKKPLHDSLDKFCEDFKNLKNSLIFKTQLNSINNRLDKIVQKKEGITAEFKMSEPLAIGLGLDHPTENGFRFDYTCGVPFLPATSIKGLCRAWAKACGKESHIIDIVGLGDDEGETARMGKVVFLPTYPKTWPNLHVDCICNHHFEYYNKSPKDRKFLKKQYPAPLDIESPVPIFHLRLRGYTTFIFRFISLDEKDPSILDRTLALLNEALLYFGIGARTAVGYGRMEAVEDTMDKMPKQWEQDIPKGIVKTFISYVHKDKETVKDFVAKGALFGITPWLDENDLMPYAGDSLDEKIKQAISSVNTVSLFLSEDSANSEWVEREIGLANKHGKHIIPILLDKDSNSVKRILNEKLKPQNPFYIDINQENAHQKWIKTIVEKSNAKISKDVAIYLGHKDANLQPSILPKSWEKMPVFDMRTPEFRKNPNYEVHSLTPNEKEYREIENAIRTLRFSFNNIRNLYVTGLCPLGIAGIVGKIWDRGSGTYSITTWNNFAEEEWRITRDDYLSYEPKTIDSLKFLSIKNSIDINEGAGKEDILVGFFFRDDQFNIALKWAKENLDISKAFQITFPQKIDSSNATQIALECSNVFSEKRKKYTPSAIYWFSGMPMAIMPLITYLSKATGKIIFMDEDKKNSSYVKAFELS